MTTKKIRAPRVVLILLTTMRRKIPDIKAIIMIAFKREIMKMVPIRIYLIVLNASMSP